MYYREHPQRLAIMSFMKKLKDQNRRRNSQWDYRTDLQKKKEADV